MFMSSIKQKGLLLSPHFMIACKHILTINKHMSYGPILVGCSLYVLCNYKYISCITCTGFKKWYNQNINLHTYIILSNMIYLQIHSVYNLSVPPVLEFHLTNMIEFSFKKMWLNYIKQKPSVRCMIRNDIYLNFVLENLEIKWLIYFSLFPFVKSNHNQKFDDQYLDHVHNVI